ncbi:MAG: phosphatidate cytidylyltransferase [Actinomycetota bacterium]|nr:phosphatidate cytidylyltransferase [Actinomycetota bacterium]
MTRRADLSQRRFQRHVQSEGESLSLRVMGAFIFVALFAGTLFWGGLPFTFGIAIACAIGSFEVFLMLERKGDTIPVAALIGTSGSVAYVFLAHVMPQESFGFVTLAIVILSFAWYMIVLKHVKPTKAIALTIFVPIITGFCLSHLVMMRDVVDKIEKHRSGLWIVLFVMSIVWMYDVAAWWAGRRFGQNKIAPSISPNKSWEGLVAGTITAIAVSVLLRFLVLWILGSDAYQWLSVPRAIVIALIVCVLGPLGDMSESMMKRDYGIKDMGSIIPGHGGIMDRFDSTLFTAPAIYYYLYYFVFHL